jgi:hypothetical protein
VAEKAKASARQDYVDLASQLANDIRSAAATVRDQDRRNGYLEALTDARRSLFERAISPAVAPGKPPTQQEMASYPSVAADHRLPEGEAKKIINRLTGIEVTENPYATYGVLRAAEDPAWPTEFDLLCLDESVSDERLIRSQMDAQVRRAREVEQKFPEPDRKRQARAFAEKVQAAAATLLAPPERQRCLKRIAQTRGAKFAEEVPLYCQPGRPVRPDAVIGLLATARRMRGSDTLARQVITQETGFADYMSLLSQRKTPVLGYVAGLKVDLPADADEEAATRRVTIRNEGGGVLQGGARPTCDWITVQPQRIRTDGIQELTVQLDTSRLPRGVPTAGQISVDTNGGSQSIAVEALLGGGDAAADPLERFFGALIYLFGTAVVPLAMVCVFVCQNRSRYLTLQAAQASVLGTVLGGTVIAGKVAMGFCCLLKFLETPIDLCMYAVMLVGLVCAVLSLLGKPIRIPIVISYAEKFAYQFGEEGPVPQVAGEVYAEKA